MHILAKSPGSLPSCVVEAIVFPPPSHEDFRVEVSLKGAPETGARRFFPSGSGSGAKCHGAGCQRDAGSQGGVLAGLDGLGYIELESRAFLVCALSSEV